MNEQEIRLELFAWLNEKSLLNGGVFLGTELEPGFKVNDKLRLNICAGIFTIIYVWGGMMSYPHYIAVATIETIIALFIIGIAWKWKNSIN